MKSNSVALKAKDTCCGCGVCSFECPKEAIKMQQDREGFVYPVVDESICVNCGLCIKICPFNKKEETENSVLFCRAGYFQSKDKLSCSSSGGAATAISVKFIKSGGIVYGAAYTDDFKSIVVKRVSDEKDLSYLKGSKYAQSTKNDAFVKIKHDLSDGLKVLFIGMPCEVAALKGFIKSDSNLFTAELICSGVTSQGVHKQFVEYIEEKKRGRVGSFTYRDGESSWHWPLIKATLTDGRIYRKPWYASMPGFAFKNFMRDSCYNCNFKGRNNKADITLGDFWGLKDTDSRFNPRGVSAIIVHTQKGEELLTDLDGFILHEADLEQIKAGNPRLYSCLSKPGKRDYFGQLFSEKGLKYAFKKCMTNKDKIKDLIKTVFTYLSVRK